MSAEQQPDPILPNYNPSSWDVPTLSPEERAILDTEYITFPIAQNQNITFPVAPTAPTLADGTNTEQVATTGFVQNAITAFKAASNVWSGIQTFTAGITTATISAISGTFTLTGATTVSNATFSGTTTLTNPLTPAYSYPIGTGKIGEIITGTNAVDLSMTASTPKTISTIDLPEGIWLLYGVAQGGGNSVFFTLSFGTTDNSITTGVVAIDTCPAGAFGVAQSIAFPVVAPAPISPATTTPYYFVSSIGLTQTLSAVVFLATRVA